MFKLSTFTVVISEKSSFAQKNEWYRFALMLFKQHEILYFDSQEKLLPPNVIF